MTDEKANGRNPIIHEKRILPLGGSRLRYRQFNMHLEPLVGEASGVTLIRSASVSAFLLDQGAIATRHLKATEGEGRQLEEPFLCDPVYLAQIDSYFWSEGAMLAGIVDKAYEKAIEWRDDEPKEVSKPVLLRKDDEGFKLYITCLKLRNDLRLKELGEQLKTMREKSGCSVLMLADELGVSIATIYRWEAVGNLPLTQLSRYLRAVGIDADRYRKSLNLNAILSAEPESMEKP